MAYRDTQDPRIALLAAQIAEEPDLRARLARTRREHDDVQARADRLGLEHAEAERARQGGLIARVTGWFGAPPAANDVERVEHELAVATAQLAALAARERELDRRLHEIADARLELANLVAQGLDALRAAEGPVGDELRALEVALATSGERLDALDTALAACDRAHVVLCELGDSYAARSEQESTARSVGRSAAAIAGILMLDPVDRSAYERERASLIARMRSHLPFARDLLVALGPVLESLRTRFDLWREDSHLARACARLASLAHAPIVEPPEDSALAREIASAVESLERITSAFTTERLAIVRHRDELAARQRGMIEPATR